MTVDSDSWCTPKWLADALGSFGLDPCSNERSHVRALRKITLPEDGLADDWAVHAPGTDDPASWAFPATVFCNPPYSNVLPWAARLSAHPGSWVALVKLDPTTKWWRALFGAKWGRPDWAPFAERLKFERPDKPPLAANFPSALVWARGWYPPVEVERRLFRAHCGSTL